MKKEELKKYVDEYFKRYMCAETLDKFIENWEETENWCEYFRKENEQLHSIIKEVREYIEEHTDNVELNIYGTYESENCVDFKVKEKDKEIERLNDKILKLETDVSIYKDLSNLRQERINKALEYIYKNGIIDLNGYDLLKILQGSDKEWKN